MYNRKTFRDYAKVAISFGVIAVFVVYGIVKILPFLLGPRLTIESPKNGETIASSTFIVEGRALRANGVMLQGKPISIDTEGYFRERLVLYSPYTILLVEARDKYGKETFTELYLSATTSPPTSL